MEITKDSLKMISDETLSLIEKLRRQTLEKEDKGWGKRRVKESLQAYFDRILEQLSRALDIEHYKLMVVGLMALLGPEDEGPPPFEFYREIIGHLANAFNGASEDRGKSLGTLESFLSNCGRQPEEMLTAASQIVIAYGCKWGRRAGSGNHRWDEIWPGARQELTYMAHGFVIAAVKKLEEMVRDFQPDWLLARDDTDLVTRDFIETIPANNAPKFHQYQTLRNWIPTKGTLHGWFKRAIWGGKKKGGDFQEQEAKLQTNYFREGLLYKYMEIDERIKTGDIAFQQCSRCDNGSEEEYSSSLCSACRNWQFVFAKPFLHVPGVYVKWSFIRCSNENRFVKPLHYCEDNFSQCPCGGQLSQRATALLIRRYIAENLTRKGIDNAAKHRFGPRARLSVPEREGKE